MNRTETRILRKVTADVVHHNKYLWWELKHQIWDFGYRSYYPRQSEYELPSKRAINHLPEQSLDELRLEYSAQYGDEPSPSRERLVEHYAMLMIEEIVRRAEIAAYRTENWWVKARLTIQSSKRRLVVRLIAYVAVIGGVST